MRNFLLVCGIFAAFGLLIVAYFVPMYFERTSIKPLEPVIVEAKPAGPKPNHPVPSPHPSPRPNAPIHGPHNPVGPPHNYGHEFYGHVYTHWVFGPTWIVSIQGWCPTLGIWLYWHEGQLCWYELYVVNGVRIYVPHDNLVILNTPYIIIQK